MGVTKLSMLCYKYSYLILLFSREKKIVVHFFWPFLAWRPFRWAISFSYWLISANWWSSLAFVTTTIGPTKNQLWAYSPVKLVYTGRESDVASGSSTFQWREKKAPCFEQDVKNDGRGTQRWNTSWTESEDASRRALWLSYGSSL